MARKKLDSASQAASRAFSKKAGSFAKSNAKRLISGKPKKSTKADNDATAILIMIVMLTFAANAISSAVNATKNKFKKDAS